MDKIWWNELWMGEMGPHYAASSNTEHAANLKGRLFLAVGEMGTNVDPSSTMQLVNALILAGKDFELLVTPNGGHGAMGPDGNRRRYFLRPLAVRHHAARLERRRHGAGAGDVIGLTITGALRLAGCRWCAGVPSRARWTRAGSGGGSRRAAGPWLAMNGRGQPRPFARRAGPRPVLI